MSKMIVKNLMNSEKCEEMEQENTALEETKGSVEDRISRLEKEKNGLNNKVIQLEKTIDKQKRIMDQKKREFLAENNGLKGKVGRLEQENKNLHDQRNASDGKIGELQTQLEKLRKDLNQAEAEKDNLKVKRVELQTEKEEIEKRTQKLEEKVRELEGNLQTPEEALIQKCKRLQEENKELQVQRNANEEKAKEMQSALQNEIDELKNKVAQLQEEKIIPEVDLDDYTNLKHEKKEVDLKVTQLEKELQKMSEKLQNSSDKQIFQHKIAPQNSQQFFDCCIAVDSLFCLTSPEKCWSIEFKDWKEYQEKSQQENSDLILGIMGNEKTGKGFVLSKLTGNENFPQDDYNKKKGIHVLCPDERLAWTILEVSRGNGMVKMEEIKNEVEDYMKNKEIPPEQMMNVLLEDSHMTENLAQEFVAQSSDVLMIMVGKLRREDQTLLARAKKFGAKKLLVIHNYSDVQSREVVKELIDVDIRSNPNIKVIKPRSAGEEPSKYLEKDNGLEIHHLVMAHEGSEAGQYYNCKAIEFAKQVINTSISSPEQFDPVDAFEKYLKDNFKRYVSSQSTLKEKLEIIVKADQKDDQQSYPQGFRLGDQYIPKIKRENIDYHIREYLAEDTPSIPFTLKEVTRDDDVINRDGKVGPKEFIQMEVETLGACNHDSLVFDFIPAGEQCKQIVVQGKIEQNIAEGKIIESTRKLGDFKIVTKPFKLGNNRIVNIIEAPEIRQNSESGSSGLTVLSWGLGTKVTSYKQH